MPLARKQLPPDSKNLVFIDDNLPQTSVNGHPVISYADFVRHPAQEKNVAIAIADSQIRQVLANKLSNDNILPWSVQDATSILMDNVEIGCGALLSPFTVITSNIKIGQFFHANIHSYVEHDCVIGDFVTFAPGVHCNGNIVIEDHVYVGAGAIIRQGTPDTPIRIGVGATIGMGAVVTKSVPAGATVVGNPARPIARQQ